VRSALDDLQQSGLGMREMSMQFCETFADTLLQQLLRGPLSSLASTRFDLNDAHYSIAEVRPCGASAYLPSTLAAKFRVHAYMIQIRSMHSPLLPLLACARHTCSADSVTLICLWPISPVVQGEVGWAKPLCTSLQHYLSAIFQGLAADAQQEVSRAVLARLLYRVEAAVSTKKFTALGGLLLDRCATATQWPQLDIVQCDRLGSAAGALALFLTQSPVPCSSAACSQQCARHRRVAQR
jgi:hypothetical protein